MGVIDDFLATGTALHVVNLHADGKQVMRLTMDELDSPYPFMLGIPQSETERLLGENLTRYGASVERQTELIDLKQTGVSVTATLKTSSQEEVMTASYVIGCDGAHSKTRHLLDLPFEGSEYPDLFWLADVAVDSDFRWDEIHLYTTGSGLCAFFPFSNNRCRVIADFTPQSGAAKTGSALQDPTLEQIQTLVNERVNKKIVLRDPVWLAAFAIHRRQVSQYKLGRVFLAGDAAHIHSPAGGQGMNTGIQDAFNLGWKLSLVLEGAAKPQLLEGYQGERHAVAQTVLQVTDFLTKVNTLRNPVTLAIRHTLAPLMAAQEVVQQRLRGTMSELAINYRKSDIVEDNKVSLTHTKIGHSDSIQPELAEWFEFDKGPHAGDRAPDAHLQAAGQSEETTLFAETRDIWHHLFLLSGTRANADGLRSLVEIGNSVSDKYSDYIKVHYVGSEENAFTPLSATGTCYWDADLSLHHKYGAASECLYLIRPMVMSVIEVYRPTKSVCTVIWKKSFYDAISLPTHSAKFPTQPRLN